MKSIAVTKPDMGVLSRDRLPLSPFGALSQAFGEELLARAEQTEGAWSYVPLELLEEGEEAAPPAPPVKPVLQVNLQLVLEALRREGRRTEQQRATERIVERILQMQERPASRQEKEKSPGRTPAQSLSVFGTVRQEFHPTFIQNIRISAPLPSQPKPMGELARKAENLSQRLQTLREEGAPPPQETHLAQGQMVPLRPHEEAPRFTGQAEQVSSRPLPQEALTLLEEQGDEAAQTVSRVQGKELLRRADQLAHQVEKVLTESAKSAANPPAPAGKHQEPDTSNQSRRTPQREGAEKNRGESGKQGRKTASHAPVAQGTSVPHGVSHTTLGETAARDIRVSPDAPLGSAAVQEHFGATAKQQTMEQMGAAPMVPGTSMVPGQMPGAPAVSGQGAVPPAPLDLSLRTEGEKAEEAGQISHKVSPAVEKTGTAEGKRPSPPASAQEKSSHSNVQPQGTQTAKMAQTAARDIRISPDTPLGSAAAQEHFGATAKQQTMEQGSVAPMAAGTSMVPGQLPGAPAVSGQGAIPPAPLDLSLRAEGEKAEEAGQISHKVSPAVEKTGTAEGKRPSPPASAQEKSSHSNVQPQGTQTAKMAQTAARDIRISPDTPLGSAAAQEHFGVTAKQQTMEQGSVAPMAAGTSMVPGQLPGAPAVSGQGAIPPAPLDLSLRAEGEKAEEAGQISHKVSPAVEKTGAAEGKQPSPPASAQEKAAHASAQPQTTETAKTAQTTQTVVRDIRVSPDTPLGSAAAQEHFRVTAKQQTMEQGSVAPMPSGTSMVPGQIPGAPAVSGQGAISPTPLDLSLRTEGEKAEEAGQISHKVSPAVEKTGAAEGKQPSPPASAQEKAAHASAQPQTTETAKTAQTTQTVVRDIRVSPDTPLGSAAAQEHFGVTAKQQTMEQGSVAPMPSGTSMVPGQLPGAPAVSGQGALTPAPLDLSLRTEGEKAEEAGQISHKVSPAVEKTGTAEGKQPSPPALSQEKVSHSNIQPQTVQTDQTAARDIRVSADGPLGSAAAQKHFGKNAKQQAMGHESAVPMVPGVPMAPGASIIPGQIPGAPAVSGQGAVPPAPLDLSLRTEGEKEEKAEEAGQISHKVFPAVEKTRAAEGKQPSPPASAQDKAAHSNVQPQTAQTAARDIRVRPDTSLGSVAAQKYFEATAKQQAMGQMGAAPMVPGTSMVPGQMPGASAVSGQGTVPPAPLDLSLRTEKEKVEGAEKAGQAFHKVFPAVEKTGAAKSKQSSPLASAQEKTSHSNIQSQTPPAPQTDKTARTTQTAARDIRVSPDTPLSSMAAQEYFGAATKQQAMGQMGTTPMVPGTSMVLGQIPGAPAVSGQGTVPPAPLDLSLRTEGENVETAGQAFHKVSPAVEKTGTTEGRPSSSPALAQKKVSHPNAQSQMAGTSQTAATGRQTAQSPQTSRFGTQNHPGPWGPRTAARDIRTGPALGHAAPDRKGAEAWMVPSLPLTWSQPHQEEPAVQPHAAGQVQAGAQAAAAAQRGTSSMAEPLSLTYGPVQGSTETPPPEPEAAQPASGEESEFVRSLPDWARRFLKQSRSSSASHAMGVARDIATVPMPEETEDVQWTAPNYRPPQATIAHREKKQEEKPKTAQEVRISEAEIQRTADRVYRIIEDRIRLERRRLGL